jgi:hypothetical protein
MSTDHHIGTLRENSLHAGLKELYAQPGDHLEAKVDGYVIDILREDTLIEIQTGSFSKLKKKLAKLCETHKVLLVHPIAEEKWIVRIDKNGEPAGRRKSPKSGRAEEIFRELVYLPHLMANENFALEILLIQQEEVLMDDGKGSWRRKGWSVANQRLLEVRDQMRFDTREDFLRLLPDGLADSFTNRELATAAKLPLRLAQKMSYTLEKMGVVARSGQRGSAHLFNIKERTPG